MVCNPAPDIRGNNLGRHNYRNQLTDLDRAETLRLEIQAPVRNQCPERGKIEKIETGKSPVHGVSKSA
jgi:hypothetical protein